MPAGTSPGRTSSTRSARFMSEPRRITACVRPRGWNGTTWPAAEDSFGLPGLRRGAAACPVAGARCDGARPRKRRPVSARRRLSICYVVPGHSLVASAGPTRNVLSLAGALSRWADVTVAFQRVADAETPDGVRLEEIEPGARVRATRGDVAAVRGLGY